MAGSYVQSTIDVVLRDDVSMPAAKVAEALERVTAKEKAVSAAIAGSGLRDRFGAQLKSMGAGLNHVEAASAAWRKFALSQELAADSTHWTKGQTAAVKQWEATTRASIRAVMGEERAMARVAESSTQAFERSQRRAAEAAEHAAQRVKHAHRAGEHFDTSTLGGTVATAGAFAFEHAMHSVIERYKDFDKERRYAKVVMGLTDEQQEPLVHQALTGGATSRFNDIQWLEAQREFAARGYNLDQVKAFTPIAADVGTAFDKTLPEAVKAIEGAMLGFGKDVSTYDKAVASARQTADYEVKTSKISGMSFDDITQLYKYGAAPAKMSGMSEAQMLAFGAVLKKNNMGGDEAGTAFRALAKNLLTPTAGAVTAMRANGIDFSTYQHVRNDPMDVTSFSGMVAQKYGVELNHAAQEGLKRIFTDRSLVSDASKYTPAVVQLLKNTLGGDDAKSLKSIAGLAKDYRNASVDGVDTVRLLTDMMGAMAKNKGLANAIFGSKQGGRIFAALNDGEVFNDILEKIRDHSAGFAGNVAAARNEGFAGQMAQLEGAVATLESSIGRAFDNGGKGGPLTEATSAARGFIQAMSEMNPSALKGVVEAAGAAAVVAGLKSIDFIKGSFGLKAAGIEMMDAGKVQLQAGRLMLEAAGAHNLPGGQPPHGEPGGGKPGEPGAKPAEPGAKPGADPGAKAPGERPGIYEKPPPAEVPKGGFKFFGPGGLKGLAGGLAEGVIGAILYQAGDDLQDALLHRGNEEKEKFNKVMQYPALHAWLDRTFGRVDDARPTDPFLSGDRDGILERARRSAEAFRADEDAERGRRMMEHFAPLPMSTGPENDGNALWRPPPPTPAAAPVTDFDGNALQRPAPARAVAPAPVTNFDGNALHANDGPASVAPGAPPPVDHSLDGIVVGQLAPKVDTSGVDGLRTAAGDAQTALNGLNTSVSPSVNNASLRETVALLDQIHAKLANMSGTVNVAINQTGSASGGVANASIGARRSFNRSTYGTSTA